jgi:hypothetical protein
MSNFAAFFVNILVRTQAAKIMKDTVNIDRGTIY